MINYYFHQLGYIYDFDTLDKLASILDLGAIGSRV